MSVARTDIVAQYEAACAQAGVHAGLVDLATFSIINGVLAGPDAAGRRLAARAPDDELRDARGAARTGRDLLPQSAEESEGPLADIVHQTAMYYEDRLKGQGFSRVLLHRRRSAGQRRRAAAGARGSASGEGGSRGSACRRVARRSHQRVAGSAVGAGAARRHSPARAKGGLTDAQDQPRDAAVLQRARRPSRHRGVVIAVAALTAFNAARDSDAARSGTPISRRARRQAEARSRSLREQASALRKTVDQGDIAVVQAAAREANLLIERRAFSWTDLFNRFEETLPADVRIAAVQPQIDDQGRMLVAVTVISTPRRGSRLVHRGARAHARLPQRAVAAGSERRRRRAAIGDPGLLRPGGAPGPTPSPPARRTGSATARRQQHAAAPNDAFAAGAALAGSAADERRSSAPARRCPLGAGDARASRRAGAARSRPRDQRRRAGPRGAAAVAARRGEPDACRCDRAHAGDGARPSSSRRRAFATARRGRRPTSRRSTSRCCPPTSPRHAA